MLNEYQKENGEFSGEEITTFKRYIEENNVYTDNNFEFFENNINYYSVRHTYSNFFSAGRLFQVNSNFIQTDEMFENSKLYNASIQWTTKTIHPDDSEYVIKEEKYRYLEGNDNKIKELAEYLNTYDISDYHCIDLLIYSRDALLKFLPGKNFTFTWRKNCSNNILKILDKLKLKNKYNEKHLCVIVPVFVPIRESLFLGEFGYRDAFITYGQVLERLMRYLDKKCNFEDIRRFDNYEIHKLLNLDGVDKNIMDIIVGEWENMNG